MLTRTLSVFGIISFYFVTVWATPIPKTMSSCQEAICQTNSTTIEIAILCETNLKDYDSLRLLISSRYGHAPDIASRNILNLFNSKVLNFDDAIRGYEALYNVIDSAGDFENTANYIIVASSLQNAIESEKLGDHSEKFGQMTVQNSAALKGEKLLSKFPSTVRAIIIDGIIGVEMTKTRHVLDSDYAGNAYTKSQNGGNYQKWRTIRDSAGLFSLQNIQTNKILDSDSKKNVYTTPWNGGANQKWTIISVSGGTQFALLNAATGFALDADGKGNLYTSAYTHGNYWQHWHSWNY